ncbi:hypothetical protein HWB81_gp31 [Bacillus phage Wes44]|uniref:Uncharacterized protein n=1 Tax=Bacillus phage Wes44 TaxID=2283012 RepID=A0A346FK35_9CAUD|nr:hypothetical protein HWB81_gp31 [Bacillus phage Wes44]AXN58340.1 hypothetical protein Wes44_31 [Bacillus phage Wes44]
MALKIYCTECDEYTEVHHEFIYKEYGGVTVVCAYCGEKEDV